MTEDRAFNIVLESCDSNNVEQITTVMSTMFPIRKEMALQLASSTPIVLLDDLTKNEANAVFSEMNDLVEAGAGIKVIGSNDLTSRMTKVKWPERPKINKKSVEEISKEGGEETVTRHSCPHCGNGIMVGMDEYGENISVTPDGDVVPMEAAGSAAAAVAAAQQTTPPPPDDAFSDDFILSNDDLIAEIEEPHIPKTEEITNILDSLLPEGGEDSFFGSTEALEPAGNTAPVSNPNPAPVAAPVADRGETVNDDKMFNVFLPKLTTDDKKEKAVPLIVEFAGLSTEEAKKLANRIVIPLVKGIGKEKADEIKERFMSVGILPRIRQQV